MLVLSRFVSEKVKITTPTGDVIVVTLLRVDCPEKKVRLGFAAPKDFRILRTELEGSVETVNSSH